MSLDFDGVRLSYQTSPASTSYSTAPMPSTNNPTFHQHSAIYSARSTPPMSNYRYRSHTQSQQAQVQGQVTEQTTLSQDEGYLSQSQGNYHTVHNSPQRSSTHYGGRQLYDLGLNANYGYGPSNFTLNPQGYWRHFGWPSNMPVGQDRAQNQFMPAGQFFGQRSTLYNYMYMYPPHYFNPNIRRTTVGQHGYGSNANITCRSYRQHDSGFQEGDTGSHQHDTGSHRRDIGFQEGDTGSQQSDTGSQQGGAGSQQDETGQQRGQIPQQGDDNYSQSPSNKPSSCTGSGEIHLTNMTNTDLPPSTALLSSSTTNDPTESQHEDLYRYHRRRAHSQSLVVERMTTSLVGRASPLTLTRSQSLDSITCKYQSGAQRNYCTSNSPSSTRQVHAFGLELAERTRTCSGSQR